MEKEHNIIIKEHDTSLKYYENLSPTFTDEWGVVFTEDKRVILKTSQKVELDCYSAFERCANIERLEIPTSLEQINNEGCDSLSKIEMPIEIEDQLFFDNLNSAAFFLVR